MVVAYYIIVMLSVWVFATLLTYGLYALLSKLALLDEPQERSNHAQPVPTGVGLGFAVIIAGFLTVATAPLSLVFGVLLLAVVSFIDDIKHLAPLKRLGFQAIAVVLAIVTIDKPVFQGLLPQWLDMTFSALLWMWMINLTNFMDGIDEITVTQTGSVTVGVYVLGALSALVPHSLMVDAMVVCVAVLAFYPFNRHPAKCFMGDAGSVPLGFLLGYLLLSMAATGLWQAALILPAYYIADATYTLARRALRKEPVWQAHSQHFYQQAVRGGRNHALVSREVLVLNVWLIALAVSTTFLPAYYALIPLLLAYVSAGALCWHFTKPVQHSSDPSSPEHAHEAAA